MRLPSTRIWLIRHTNLLSRVEIFEYVMAGSGIVWTLNSDILSGDVTRSRPVLYREYCICIQYGNLIPRISLLPALRRMLCCRRVLRTRVNPDTCRIRVACERQTFLLARRSPARIRVDGQIRFEYGNVSTRKFLNPHRNANT